MNNPVQGEAAARGREYSTLIIAPKVRHYMAKLCFHASIQDVAHLRRAIRWSGVSHTPSCALRACTGLFTFYAFGVRYQLQNVIYLLLVPTPQNKISPTLKIIFHFQLIFVSLQKKVRCKFLNSAEPVLIRQKVFKM